MIVNKYVIPALDAAVEKVVAALVKPFRIVLFDCALTVLPNLIL